MTKLDMFVWCVRAHRGLVPAYSFAHAGDVTGVGAWTVYDDLPAIARGDPGEYLYNGEHPSDFVSSFLWFDRADWGKHYNHVFYIMSERFA